MSEKPVDIALSHEVDAHGHRKFYDFEFVDETLHTLLSKNKDYKEQEDTSKLIKYLRENIIGADYIFKSPYGLRKGKACFHMVYWGSEISKPLRTWVLSATTYIHAVFSIREFIGLLLAPGVANVCMCCL